MTIIELGALGELVGAIAVVATLVYLAAQIRHNTRVMEENERLALAQTYQMRADSLQSMLVQAADSEYIGPIITKLTEAGYPENVESLTVLDDTERGRFRQWHIAQLTHWDNMYFQYEQGFLDEEYYHHSIRERVIRLAPIWEALHITGMRQSFKDEIARLLDERASTSTQDEGRRA